MTPEQIIKALECCSGIQRCIDCPYTKVDKCAEKSARDTIALIKELQAQNENLKKENKYLRESLADEREHKEDMEGKDE